MVHSQDGEDGPFTLHYNDYKDGSSKVGKPEKLEVDVVIGADGANSRVAKEIDAGDYDYAIAFQVRRKSWQLYLGPLIASQTYRSELLCNSSLPLALFGEDGTIIAPSVLICVSVAPVALSICFTMQTGAYSHPRRQDGLLQGYGRDVCWR